MSRASIPGQTISSTRIFSVGHSNHELDELLQVLIAAGVTMVADVRSRPYSGRYPQFNRPQLESVLRASDLGYTFLGDLLGGRPEQSSLYDGDGRVDYQRVRTKAAFKRGIEQLICASREDRVAMLCAEEDPLDCHRGLMITPALVEHGIVPAHLRRDATVETNDQMERRLHAETGVGAGILDGLFAATVTESERRELMAEAYRAMSRRKAFRLRPDESIEFE